MLNLPSNQEQKQKLLAALHRLSNDSDYLILKTFLEEEQVKLDQRLRNADRDFLRVQGHAQLLVRLLELSSDATKLLNSQPKQP